MADAPGWPWRRMVGGVLALTLAASTVAVGCSQEGRSTSGGEAVVPASEAGPEARLVRRYVAALDRGETSEAMALRCTASRIKRSDERPFASQVRRLRRALGPIKVVSVTAAAAIGMEPAQPGGHPKELLVRLSYGGRTAKRSLRLIAVDEGNERRLCGMLTDPPVALRDLPVPRDLGPTSVSPQRMLPVTGPKGWSRGRDESLKLKPGIVAIASRVWPARSFGGARSTAFQFETSEKAAEESADWFRWTAASIVGTFEVPSIPGAVGVRYLASGWTWVQAPSEAPFIDSIVLRGGDRVADVTVTIPDLGRDHHLARELASELAEHAELD